MNLLLLSLKMGSELCGPWRGGLRLAQGSACCWLSCCCCWSTCCCQASGVMSELRCHWAAGWGGSMRPSPLEPFRPGFGTSLTGASGMGSSGFWTWGALGVGSCPGREMRILVKQDSRIESLEVQLIVHRNGRAGKGTYESEGILFWLDVFHGSCFMADFEGTLK